MKRIAVFASGFGSNFQYLIDAQNKGELAGEIGILVSDKPNAVAVQRAKENSIPVFAFQAKEYNSKEAYESKIVEILQQYQIDVIVLAGFMRIIGKTLLQSFPNKMINLHPSLLPSFPGKDAIGQAFEYGVKVTGVTVHYIDEGMDTGPIINQRPVYIKNEDSLESLTERIHHMEHDILLESVNFVLNEKTRLDGRKVSVEG